MEEGSLCDLVQRLHDIILAHQARDGSNHCVCMPPVAPCKGCSYHIHVAEHHSEAKPLLQLADAEVEVVRVKEVVA